MLPKNRITTHPGKILQEEFLVPLKLSQVKLGALTGMSLQRINELVNGKRGMTAETALLLAKVFKNSPQFWMNLQTSYDLTVAMDKMRRKAS